MSETHIQEYQNGPIAAVMYKIDRDILSGKEMDSFPEALKVFIQKYKNAEMDIKVKQDFTFTVANSLMLMEKFDEAAEYLNKSMELLEQFPKKDTDIQLKKAQLYGLYVDIAVSLKDKVKTMEYIQLAFECNNLKTADPYLYFFLLGCKRKHVPQEDKMELSIQMYEIWSKSGKSKKQQLDVFYNLFEDYCYKKDFEKAEEMCWKIYSDKECLNFDKKEVVKKSLIFIYKLSKRLADIEKFKISDSDFEKVAYIYQKIADELHIMENYELAYQYYEKMKEYVMNLPENEEKTKLRHYVVESLFLSLDEFAWCQKDLKQLLQHVEELLQLQEMLKVSEDIFIKTQLDYAVIKSKCDDVPFEEKKTTLLKIYDDNKLRSDIEFFEFFSNVAAFVESHPDQCNQQHLPEVEEKVKIYKEKLKTYKAPPKNFAFAPYSNEDDVMSDQEILKIINDKWKHFDKIQLFKKKLKKIDVFGETELFKSISSNSNMEHIKFLIEECGYYDIMEKADNCRITPLHLAVLKNRIDIVKYFIKKGANINAATTAKCVKDPPAGTTPLMEAILQRNADMIELLLQNGANPMIKNVNGHAALYLLYHQIRTGNKHSKGTPGPKSSMKEKPVSADVLENLIKARASLKKAVNEYKQNHDELSQQNPITQHATSTNECSRKRRRHENVNDENVNV